VTDRVSKIIPLCEDDAQQRLAFEYMKHCGINTKYNVDRIVISRLRKGSAKQGVIQEFPRQLHACRQRSSRVRTQLVVFVDADEESVEKREQQLWDSVSKAGYDERQDGDSIVLLIPRWHVETWIRALLGQPVTEDQPCKGWDEPSREEMRLAARAAYEWARENATPGPTCVPSLKRALPEWRKIG
jgi:hypothetical protein